MKSGTLLPPWRKQPVPLVELAARIGRSKSHLSRVLSGERKPSAPLYAALVACGAIAGKKKGKSK